VIDKFTKTINGISQELGNQVNGLQTQIGRVEYIMSIQSDEIHDIKRGMTIPQTVLKKAKSSFF
jgi:hypothetical protein